MIKVSASSQGDITDLCNYSLQLNRWYLKPIGAWPSSSSTPKHERIISTILIILCYCLIAFTVVPSFLNILLEDEDIRKKLKILGPLGHWFVGGINYTTLLLRRKEIHRCVEHMKMDWRMVTRGRDQRAMLKFARLGRYVAAFCGAFMQVGVLSYCAVTAFATEIVYVGNQTRTVHLQPCAVYKKLLNVDTNPMNEIVLASQFLSGFIVNSSAVGAFSLAAVFGAHACGQLDVMMTWITEYVNEPGQKDKVYLNKIGTIVEHHLRVFSFISRIEYVMNRICFMELFKCTLDMCMLGYYILTEWADHDVQNLTTYFIILTSMCFNIFTVCYIGEVLMEQIQIHHLARVPLKSAMAIGKVYPMNSQQCKKVGEVVYMTNWYYLPDKAILDLILIIARSSVVIKMTAGKFIHMSVYTFGDVMKTAFAYLNFLRQTT